MRDVGKPFTWEFLSSNWVSVTVKCFKVDSGGKSYIHAHRWYSRLPRSPKVKGKSGEEGSREHGG